MKCSSCGRVYRDRCAFCPFCGTPKETVVATLDVGAVAAGEIKNLPPKDRKKAQAVLDMARQMEPVDVDVEDKTWRELGFDIDEPPPTPGTFASEKKFKTWLNRSQRAQGLESDGKVDQAIKFYQKNVEEWTEIPIDYERLAIIYAKRGDLEKALEYCELALVSPACTNPAQDTARRNFTQRKQKLQERIAKKKAGS